MPENCPLIITGMHRSGTSMIAGYLAHAGLQLGSNLMQGSEHNPHGYFEDKDLVELNGKILKACVQGGRNGWPDWGYTEDLFFDHSIVEQFKAEAKQLIKKKSSETFWGWKDPRTTLLLDFWIDLLPHAKVLCIYRNPWEVKQSMAKLNAPVFNQHPQYAYDIWNWYNTYLLKFAIDNPERCITIQSNAFIQNPKKLSTLLEEKWNYSFDPIKVADYSFYDANLFEGAIDLSFVNNFLSQADYTKTLDQLNNISAISADSQIDKNENYLDKVSVIIPCYNQGQYLNESLNSVLSSRNKGFEIIIVNDGSTSPETLSILNQLENPSIKVINQTNKGLANARNRGMKEANGDYLLFLDADNKVDPKYLSEAAAILKNDDSLAVVYANPRFFGDDSLMRKLDDYNIVSLLAQNYIDACTVIRKKSLLEIGGFDETMPIQGYEDWELWIHLYKQGWKFYHIDEFLFDYRVSKQSMVTESNKPHNREAIMRYMIEKHTDVYQKHLKNLIPLLTKNFATVENLAIERQQVIDQMLPNSNKSTKADLKSVVKKNKALNKLFNYFKK